MHIGTWENWKIRISAVLWFVLGLGFLLSLPIIFGWAAWAFIIVLVVATLLALPTAWLIGRFASRDRRASFIGRWLKAELVWLFVLSILVAGPIYYLASVTEFRPAVVPQATLTDGKKTVVFQGMMHVGSENFYKSVIYDLEKALSEGYVLYYESVQTATPESKEFFAKFTKALTGRGGDLSANYKMMAQTCGLKFQSDYFGLLEADKKVNPERHVIADVDAIDMKREYERLMQSDPAFAKAHANDFKSQPHAEPLDAPLMQGAVEWLNSETTSRKSLMGVVCRGYMTMALTANEEKEPGPFEPIVLDFRNRELAKRIVDDSHDKIFITYGSRHLSGVLDLLVKQNPAWHVASLKWIRTIEVPKRQLTGKLASTQ